MRVNIDWSINMSDTTSVDRRGRGRRACCGVSRATLYAYVSRGFVRSQSAPGSSRERRYSRDDVERLRRRTEERRDPDKAAARALQWGMPILESSIALIDGDRLYYRGHDAVGAGAIAIVEEVASLIWTGGFDARRPPTSAGAMGGARRAGQAVPFVARAQSVLAVASAATAGVRPAAGRRRAMPAGESSELLTSRRHGPRRRADASTRRWRGRGGSAAGGGRSAARGARSSAPTTSSTCRRSPRGAWRRPARIRTPS